MAHHPSATDSNADCVGFERCPAPCAWCTNRRGGSLQNKQAGPKGPPSLLALHRLVSCVACCAAASQEPIAAAAMHGLHLEQAAGGAPAREGGGGGGAHLERGPLHCMQVRRPTPSGTQNSRPRPAQTPEPRTQNLAHNTAAQQLQPHAPAAGRGAFTGPMWPRCNRRTQAAAAGGGAMPAVQRPGHKQAHGYPLQEDTPLSCNPGLDWYNTWQQEARALACRARREQILKHSSLSCHQARDRGPAC